LREDNKKMEGRIRMKEEGGGMKKEEEGMMKEEEG
jgi:hypothetical protein